MKPGERIRLIRECTAALETMGDAAMVMRTFEIPVYTDYGGSLLIVPSLEDTPDLKLEEFAAYLTGEAAAPSPADHDAIWGSAPVRAFLSHLSTQSAFMHLLKERLAVWGLRFA